MFAMPIGAPRKRSSTRQSSSPSAIARFAQNGGVSAPQNSHSPSLPCTSRYVGIGPRGSCCPASRITLGARSHAIVSIANVAAICDSSNRSPRLLCVRAYSDAATDSAPTTPCAYPATGRFTSTGRGSYRYCASHTADTACTSASSGGNAAHRPRDP